MKHDDDLDEEYLKSLVEKPEDKRSSYFQKPLFLVPAVALILLTVGSYTMLTWLQKMF